MAKLDVMQLENPVTLQRGMVGSCSVINFGAKAHVKLGLVIEDDIYLDVVNIDHYNMIIGTPFMWKHGLGLNFGHDTLCVHGYDVCTLTTGQEDLMLTKKRDQHTCVLVT
jgi:hypothetical protein